MDEQIEIYDTNRGFAPEHERSSRMQTVNEIQTVPMACYEAQAERCRRIVRCIATGWAVSVIALSVSLATVLMA